MKCNNSPQNTSCLLSLIACMFEYRDERDWSHLPCPAIFACLPESHHSSCLASITLALFIHSSIEVIPRYFNCIAAPLLSSQSLSCLGIFSPPPHHSAPQPPPHGPQNFPLSFSSARITAVASPRPRYAREHSERGWECTSAASLWASGPGSYGRRWATPVYSCLYTDICLGEGLSWRDVSARDRELVDLVFQRERSMLHYLAVSLRNRS